LGVTSFERSAGAWYFPEHTELTRLALQDYAPAFVSTTLDKIIAELRRAEHATEYCGVREQGIDIPKPPFSALCPSVTTRLSAVPEGRNACVPYGALAALAGDHANTACGLLSELVPQPGSQRRLHRFVGRMLPRHPSDPLGITLMEAAQATWMEFQDSAPPEVVRVYADPIGRLKPSAIGFPKSLNPRDYVRHLDAALLVLDPLYTSRAR
jgi:hypothetical protein